MRTNLQKSFFRKVIFLCFLFVFGVLAIKPDPIFIPTQEADAITITDTESAYVIQELWDSSAKIFNGTNVRKLYRIINNTVDTTYDDMVTKGGSTVTAMTIYNNTYKKGANKELLVTLGGLTWTPVYLSLNISGQPILTLMLSGDQKAWTDRSNTEGTYYGYTETTSGYKGLFSRWSYCVGDDSCTVTYPTMVYGQSYINAVTLNNGGYYTTSTSTRANYTQSSSSAFAMFTMSSYGLTDYLEKPINVAWQRTQTSRGKRGTEPSVYDRPNENAVTLSSPNYYGDAGSLVSKTNYYAWANSYLWLPSLEEVGGGGYRGSVSYGNGYTNYFTYFGEGTNYSSGIWRLRHGQRANSTGSTNTLAGIGSDNQNAIPYTWLRTAASGDYNATAKHIFSLPPTCVKSYSTTSSGASTTVKNYYTNVPEAEYTNLQQNSSPTAMYAVRPCLHLNLYSVENHRTVPKIDIDEATISSVSDVAWNPVVNAIPTVTVRDSDSGATLREGTDYNVTVQAPSGIGSGIVTVTGIGNCTNSKAIRYNVVARDINIALRDNTVSIKGQFYTGSAIMPTITGLKDYAYETLTSSAKNSESGVPLTSETHYVLEYTNYTNAGIATVTVRGSGNYSGTKNYNFAIVAPETITTQQWNPVSNTTPTLTIRDDVKGTYLVKDTDYIVGTPTISNSSATLTITGRNDYEGTCTVTYLLASRDMELALRDNDITIKGQFYTGSAITPTISTVLKDYAYETSSSSTKLSASGINLVLNTDYTLDYSNNVGSGIATLIIRGKGNYSGTKNINFAIVAPSSVSTVQWNPSGTAVPTFTMIDTLKSFTLVKDSDYTVGTPTINSNTGSVTITAAGSNYEGSTTLTYSITQRSIALATKGNTIMVKHQFYTGSALTPQIASFADYGYESEDSVTPLSPAGVALVKGVDYSITHTNNVYIGTGSVVISGIGKYTGTKIVYFGIVGPDSISQREWNPASSMLPEINIRNTYTNEVLVKDVDYTAIATNTSTPGTATVNITGKGNYEGTYTATYSLTQRNINVALRDNDLTIDNQFYTGSEVKPKLKAARDYGYETASSTEKLSLSGIPLVEGSHYTLSYAYNVELGTATVYISGEGNYYGAATTSFEIIRPSITSGTLTLNKTSVEYKFGNDISTEITTTLTAGGRTLTKGTEYTVTLYDSTGTINISTISSVGSYIVRATGVGSFSGSVDARFTVEAHTINSSYLTITSTPTYTGSARNADYTLIARYNYGGASSTYSFVKDVDYSVTFSNNIDATNAAQISITGMGSFRGTVNKSYTIKAKSVDELKVTLEDNQFEYQNRAITPGVTVEDLTIGTTLTENTDYTITYNNNTNVGQASVVVTGKGNYDNTTKKTIYFSITQRDISNATIFPISDQYYTGTSIEPSLTIVDGEKTLVKNTDYTVVCSSNVNVGQATIRIDGRNNYKGSRTTEFTITRANLAAEGVRITLNPTTAVYTGRRINVTITISMPNNSYVAVNNYEVSVTKDGETLANGISDIIGVGIYTIVITGKNNFEGVTQANFEVTQANLSDVQATINKSTFTYSGLEQKPTEQLIYNGRALQKDVDYTLEYRKGTAYGITVLSPIDADTYYLVIQGMGAFQGENIGLNFTINPVSLTTGVVVMFTSTGLDTISETVFNSLNYTFENVERRVTPKSVKISNVEYLSGSTSYLDVEHYRDDIITTDFTSAGTITIKITPNTDNIQGEKVYSYRIKRRSLTNNASIVVTGLENATYDRVPHNNHSITLVDGGANNYRLTADDYMVNYPTDCTSANRAVVVKFEATSTGNYEGRLEKSFEIRKATVDSFELTSEGGTYNTMNHSFSAIVSAGSLTLDSTEYTLSYTRNGVATTDFVNAGIIVVTLGVNTNSNFEIAASVQPKAYTISSIEISSVSLVRTSQPFNNSLQELAISNVFAEGSVTLLNTDYDVQWKYEKTNSNVAKDASGKYTAKNAGVYTLTVTGKYISSTGQTNVTGQATAQYEITVVELTYGVVKYYQVDSEGQYIYSNGQKIQVNLETDYRGQRVKPEIVLDLGASSYSLQMSTNPLAGSPDGDFTFGVYALGAEITPANNLLQNGSNYISVGEYNFVITGINNFTGLIEKVYKVNLAEFNQSNIELTIVDENVLVYSGSAIEFVFNTETQNNGQVIIEHVDNKQAEDERRLELFIDKDFVLFSGYVQINFSAINENVIESATIVPASEVPGSPEECERNNIIHVQNGYVNNTSIGTASLVIASKTGSEFVTNSVAILNFRIKKLVINATNTTIAVEDSYQYSGSPVINASSVVVKRNNIQLVYNSDYTLLFERNNEETSDLISAGSVVIKVVGINSYESDEVNPFKKTISITQKALEGEMFVVSADVVYNGSEQRPTITGTINGSSLTKNVDYIESYSVAGGATPDFIKAQEITITITGIGNFSGEITKTYTIEKQVINEIIIDGGSRVTFTGSAQTINAEVYDIANNIVDSSEYTINYSSNDLTSVGTIKLIVTTGSSSNYQVLEEVSTNFVISKAQLGDVTGSIADVSYSGYINRPEKKDISLRLGSYVLKSTDFEIESVSNSLSVSTDDQKATVVLVAAGGNFEGRKEVQFNILPKNIEGVTFGNYATELPYNAESQIPTFVLSFGSRMVLNVDYTISVERTSGVHDLDDLGDIATDRFINVGNFTATINGIGNFSGSVAKTYKITARSLAGQDTRIDVVFANTSSLIYNGSEIVPTITKIDVIISGVRITLKSDDYNAVFTNNINAGNANIIVTGTGNFTGSIAKNFTIEPCELNETNFGVTINSKPYIGERIYLSSSTDVRVYRKSDDAEVSYTNYEINYSEYALNVGEYTVVIKGKENYKGSIQATFNVTPISLSGADVSYRVEGSALNATDFLDIKYTGVSVEPSVRDNIIVRIGEVYLRYSTDFVIVFDSSDLAEERFLIDVGRKDFRIVPRTGNNNIIGEKSSYFEIVKRDLADCTFDFLSNTFVYTGLEIKPQYTLTFNNIALREDIDYTIGWSNNTTCGTGLCTIQAPTARGENFEGIKTFEFTISKAKPRVEITLEDAEFFVGDSVSEESFGIKALVGDVPVDGELKLNDNKPLTLRVGDNSIKYEFIPNDPINYERATGTLRVFAVYYVKVTFKYNRGPVQNVVASAGAKVEATVELKVGEQIQTLVRGRDYIETLIYTDTYDVVDGIYKAGNYQVLVEMMEPSTYVIKTESSIEFYAKSKTIYANNAPFYAVSTDFFEEGVELVVEVYEAKRDIVSIIGAENYDIISNVGRVYMVKGLFKNGSEIPVNNITIYFECETADMYLYGDDNQLSSAYRDVGRVQVEKGVYIIESSRSTNITTIIIIVVAAVAVLIIAFVIILKISSNKKYKIAMANNRVDMNKLNSIANGLGMQNSMSEQQMQYNNQTSGFDQYGNMQNGLNNDYTQAQGMYNSQQNSMQNSMGMQGTSSTQQQSGLGQSGTLQSGSTSQLNSMGQTSGMQQSSGMGQTTSSNQASGFNHTGSASQTSGMTQPNNMGHSPLNQTTSAGQTSGVTHTNSVVQPNSTTQPNAGQTSNLTHTGSTLQPNNISRPSGLTGGAPSSQGLHPGTQSSGSGGMNSSQTSSPQNNNNSTNGTN